MKFPLEEIERRKQFYMTIPAEAEREREGEKIYRRKGKKE